MAHSLHDSGDTLRDLGQFERAAEKYEEAIAIFESLDKLWNASFVIHSLADAALDQRDTQQASDRYREALAVSVDLDDKRTIAYCLAGLSCAAALSGDLGRAGMLWAAAELFEDAYGSRILAVRTRALRAPAREAQARPAFVTAYERGRQLTPEHALEHALRTAEPNDVGGAERVPG